MHCHLPHVGTICLYYLYAVVPMLRSNKKWFTASLDAMKHVEREMQPISHMHLAACSCHAVK